MDPIRRSRTGGSCTSRRKGLGACLLALTFAAAALLALPGAAFPAGQIVIRGADAGSHLRLTTDGGNVYVNGYLAEGEQPGCRVTHARSEAVCAAAGGDSIQIVMGSSGDKVEVLDPLPLPTTSYLGNGSDKFIGNAEPDTCYPQGARRNRCYGGAGNDVCITGKRNSDCVGDGGDDYAVHRTGSDGCWGDFAFGADAPAKDDPMQGEPGDDVCLMGAGKDGAHGGPGDDLLDEGSGNGRLYGQGGEDILLAGGGSNKLSGGGGRDILYAPRHNRSSSRLNGGPGHDVCYGVRGRDGFHSCEVKVNLKHRHHAPTERKLRRKYLAAWPAG